MRIQAPTYAYAGALMVALYGAPLTFPSGAGIASEFGMVVAQRSPKPAPSARFRRDFGPVERPSRALRTECHWHVTLRPPGPQGVRPVMHCHPYSGPHGHPGWAWYP